MVAQEAAHFKCPFLLGKLLTNSLGLKIFLIAIKKVIKKQVCNVNVIKDWYYIHWNEKGN